MRLLLISAILILTAGCAHKLPMAVDSSSKSLDLGEKSLLLLTMDISRQEESRYQPVPRFLRVGEVDGEGKITTLKVLPLDDDGTLSVNGGKTLYVFRVAVAEGKTGIPSLYGQARAFPILGQFDIPLGMEVPVGKSSAIYLGRIEAVLRPRADHEYRAGPVIPLIDQAATGLSGGTWEIRLVDRSGEDLPLLRASYPALAGTRIETRLVPLVDRAFLDRQWRGEDVTGLDPYAENRKSLQALSLAPPARADSTAPAATRLQSAVIQGTTRSKRVSVATTKR